MAELAAGAVSSLLVVIHNEAVLLRGVRDDVQFIKEEMESMNSFLAHLARTEPPGGHNEQVRTWMSQVRLLAQDCNNCINLYLYRGNPDIHRARAGLRRYLWWARWLLYKLVAQHNAARELSQLKERARDVGERRMRYGVEVPKKSAGRRSARAAAGGGGYTAADDEEDRDYYQLKTGTGQHRRRAFFEPPTMEDYVKAKLLEWEYDIPACAGETLSLAIVAPNADQHVLALAHETLVVLPPRDHTSPQTPPALHLNFLQQRARPIEDFCGYHRGITVDIPAVHLYFVPLRPEDVLYYILRELQHAKSQPQKHEKDEGQEQGSLDILQDYRKKRSIYREKKRVFSKIEDRIKMNEIYEKLDRIKSDVKDRKNKDKQQQLHEDLEQEDLDQLDLDALFELLHYSAAAASSQQDQLKDEESSIMKIAKKLKQYIEANEETKELMGVVEEAGESGEQDTEEEEKQGEEGTRIDSCKEKDDKEDHNEENEKENSSGGRKEENDDKEKEKGGGDGASGESKENEENERQKELQNDKKVKEEGGGEGRMKNKQKEGNEEEEEQYYLYSLFEEEEEECPIHLDELQYAHIIREAFEKTINKKPLQDHQQDRFEAKKATKTTTTVLSEERVTEIIHKVKQGILKELQEGKLDKNKALGEPTDTATNVPSQNKKDDSELERKFEEMKQKIKEQLKIKGLVDKIKDHFGHECPLIILKVDRMMDESIWEDTRKALSLLKLSADALIFTTIKDIQRAKRYCYPSREPIVYSPFGLYHHTVLELTSEQKDEDNYNPMLFREILEECEPHEFCMRIFTHALHSNPKRSTEELKKLRDSLRTKPKSFDIIAKKMFKYSYNDLPREYKSCFLYLAIFPQEQSIRRSTLVGRWVAEGLIFKEDWHSSVLEAKRCFDALINRWLIYPADIGATGKVKSCLVGNLVHGFITTIAKKQHIVEARLSHRFARHFSIFNDLKLRNTDKIEKLLEMLSESSQLSLHKLKVLDLEGCPCFDGKNRDDRYLKEICSKMLLLKYLSLRRTEIRHLPDEINNLRELEVLDIRETKVPANATVNVLLLKLKRLLAGNNPSNSVNNSSVQIPHKIGKMENIEVLSNVEAKSKRDFKEIGELCHLRKLGVVFEDKDNHIKHFLNKTIKNLHECLCSLSITFSKGRRECTPSSGVLLPSASLAAIPSVLCGCSCTPMDLSLCARPAASAAEQTVTVHTGPNLEPKEQPPKHLESLSISGTTKREDLLPLFTKDGNNNTLTKITLCSTPLTGHDMEILAKLPKLRCVRLRHIKYAEEGDLTLTFTTGGFKCLKYLLVEGSNVTNIIFQDNAANELEMMVLSSAKIGSVSGVAKLKKLEELELNNHRSSSSLLSSFENAKQIAKLTLGGTLLEGDLEILAKKLKLQCLVLLDTSCDATQNKISFNKDEFLELNLLDVRHSAITEIVFANGSARKLQKIIWSSSTCKSLSGIRNLPRLEELESQGDCISDELKKDIGEHRNRPKHKHIEPENRDPATEPKNNKNDGPSRFPFCWKNRD